MKSVDAAGVEHHVVLRVEAELTDAVGDVAAVVREGCCRYGADWLMAFGRPAVIFWSRQVDPLEQCCSA
jgi:hypothetical protein